MLDTIRVQPPRSTRPPVMIMRASNSMGVPDVRARGALVAKRSADGWWAVEYQWWNPPGHCTFPEVVAWPGVGAPNPFVTIHALAILA